MEKKLHKDVSNSNGTQRLHKDGSNSNGTQKVYKNTSNSNGTQNVYKNSSNSNGTQNKQDPNKFTKKKKKTFLIPLIIFAVAAIVYVAQYLVFELAPYREIAGEYYLYHDTHEKDKVLTISGQSWEFDGKKGFVRYGEKTQSIELIYKGANAITIEEAFCKGEIEDGVIYASAPHAFYCFCPLDKTPKSRNQILAMSMIFQNPKYSTVIGPGTYISSKIEIPEDSDLIQISENAFKDCYWIKSLTIPDNIRIIEKNAFEGCTSLIETVGGVKYVDNWVVGVDPSKSFVMIREGTVGIADYAFSESNIKTVNMPDSVRYIGAGAFMECKELASVDLSNGLYTIDNEAFYMCTSLRNVTIPSSVHAVGSCAFFGNTTLEVTVLGSTENFASDWNKRETN